MILESAKRTNVIFITVLIIIGDLSNNTYCQSLQTGQASFYADKFEGRMTASGMTFRQDSLTAAHLTIPFGTKVKVTNIANSKSVVVVINDRGPNVSGRIIDLSRKAMEILGGTDRGIIEVKIEMVSP